MVDNALGQTLKIFLTVLFQTAIPLVEQKSEVYVDEMCAYFFFLFFFFRLYRVNAWHRFIVVCKVRTFFQSESIGPSFFSSAACLTSGVNTKEPKESDRWPGR